MFFELRQYRILHGKRDEWVKVHGRDPGRSRTFASGMNGSTTCWTDHTAITSAAAANRVCRVTTSN